MCALFSSVNQLFNGRLAAIVLLVEQLRKWQTRWAQLLPICCSSTEISPFYLFFFFLGLGGRGVAVESHEFFSLVCCWITWKIMRIYVVKVLSIPFVKQSMVRSCNFFSRDNLSQINLTSHDNNLHWVWHFPSLMAKPLTVHWFFFFLLLRDHKNICETIHTE